MAVKCPKCHSDNTDTARFCSNCATALPPSEEIPVPDINPHAAEMTEFARAVRAGAEPETGGREGLLALAVVWAAIMSAEQNRPIEVKEALGDAASLAT